MAYSKTKKILFILLCLFVILFPFYLITPVLADTEEIDFDIVSGISINVNGNSFISSTNNVGYVELEKGYIYYFHNNNNSSSLALATSSDIPSLNGTYNFIGLLSAQETYTYVTNNNTVMYFDFTSNSTGTAMTVTREKLTNMDGAVNDLVDNVGINSIWNIFDISINYIVIVVLVAFGLFIIFRIIRKVSKGKEGF